MKNIVFNESCLSGLKRLSDKSVNCCVTSPPYFGLRDYGTSNQIGLEDSPEEFVKSLVSVFRELKRVLMDDGTLWLNLGDSYANDKLKGFKQKDLIGIPWRVAFALQEDGWYLRQDIIWNKPNPMPESVTDRCTKSHEYIFLLSKSKKYYYDYQFIMQKVALATIGRISQNLDSQHGSERVPGKTNGNMKAVASWKGSGFENGKTAAAINNGRKSGNKYPKTAKERGCSDNTGSNVCGSVPWEGLKANKKSVWTVSTKPFKEAHFATFPEYLIVDCIKAGCPIDGIVLDPFMGAFTTALVSRKLGRNYIGFETNPDYIKIGEKRLEKELGLFI
jgi:DNA modification methylase